MKVRKTEAKTATAQRFELVAGLPRQYNHIDSNTIVTSWLYKLKKMRYSYDNDVHDDDVHDNDVHDNDVHDNDVQF